MATNKVTMKVEADVVAELKALVPPKKTYSYTIKMLIDHYHNHRVPAKGPAANKFRK
jgi:hypothetical protein